MKNKKNKSPNKNRIPAKEVIKSFRTQKQMWIICAGALLWVLIFCYIPMMGNIIAFFDYIPGRSLFECDFIGFKNWIDFFSLPDMWRVFRNTLVISGLSMTIGFVMPIIFALLLNEIHHTLFKKVIQTISYLPYFISWVVVASILFTLLGTEGNINSLLMHFGWIQKPISFLNEKNYFWGILTSANIWKDLGWSAIIYISAIAGVDQELYEAGDLDGAGRLQKMRYVTLPCIKGTIVIMVIFAVAGIMNNNFDQLYVLQNSFNLERSEVIDTYIYKVGLQQLQFGMAAAVNIFKSILAIILLTTANFVSNKLTDSGLF